MANGKEWTDEDDLFVRTHYASLGAQECADKLGRSIMSVYSRARRIGAEGKLGRIQKYHKELKDFGSLLLLLENTRHLVQMMNNQQIADLLRSVSTLTKTLEDEARRRSKNET